MALRLFRPATRIALQARCFSVGLTEPDDIKFSPVYVHHLSTVVLEHLQNNHSEWIVQKKLETGLKLNPDGTFVLQFPSSGGRKENGRIWTSYDGAKKQHWLSVYKDGSLGRFLIKDAVEGGGLSETAINDFVRNSVDKLVTNLDTIEDVSR